MAGIRIMHRDGTAVSHPNIWVDPDEVPVVFIMVKDGATALAHPEYISDLLYQIDQGDLESALAWDHLLVKTPSMPYPERCRVRMLTGTDGSAEILVANKIVFRAGGYT